MFYSLPENFDHLVLARDLDRGESYLIKLVENGRLLLEFEQSQFAHAYRTGWLHSDYGMFVTNSTVNPGRFRDYAVKQDPEIDIVAVFYQSNKKFKYSLRSSDIDVSTIAKHYGGGGHKNAAGFTLDYNLFSL
jgi:hypothetical protein